MLNLLLHRPRIVIPRATGLLLFLIAVTACGQLAEGQATPGGERASSAAERIIDAIITAAADLNFDESDFPADWNIESIGDGDGLLQLLATDSDPSGNAVSAVVERLASAEDAEKALRDALAALSSPLGDESTDATEAIKLGDEGLIAPDGDSWVALFRVDNVIARVSAQSGGPSATSKAATLNWAERLESRISERSQRARSVVLESNPGNGKPSENSRPPIFSSAGAAPGLAIAATAIAESKITSRELDAEDAGSLEQNSLTTGPESLAIAGTAQESQANQPAVTATEPTPTETPATPAPATSAPPDLVISGALPNPAVADSGQRITWSVIINNAGGSPSETLNLNVFGHASLDGSQLLVQQIRVPAIEPGSSFTAPVNRNAKPGEFLTFVAGDETTADADFENNSHTVALGNYMLPDLLISSHEPEISDAAPGQTIDWSVTVRNAGPGDTHEATTVTLVDAASGDEIASAAVPIMTRGEAVTRTFQVEATSGGLITFSVDTGQSVDEAVEDNNSYDDIATRSALRPDPLLISITPDPANPLPGEPVDWLATIGNNGPGDGGNLTFRVLSEIGDQTTVVHQALLPGVPIGETEEAIFSRNAQIGETLIFEIEPESGSEVNIFNNSVTVELEDIFLPDLVITELEPNRHDVEKGQGFSWNITVENIGGGNPIRESRVAMIDTNTGEEIGSVRIPLLFAGKDASVTLPLISAISQSLVLMIDPEETIQEADEENNTLNREIIDFLVHDLTMDRLAVNAAIDEDGIASWQWSITNNGPGRALDITITTTIHLDPTGVITLDPIQLASLEPGETVGGSFKRVAIQSERIVMQATTDPQVESFEFDNTVDVMGSDFF